MTGKRTIRITITTLIALATALTLALPALADGPAAAAWLRTVQNADGGFGDPESSIGATADVLLAVAASGENAIGWAQEGGLPALAYLQTQAPALAKAGETAKVVLALVATGQNPRDLGGTDLVAVLEGLVGADGKIGGETEFVNEHCYALFALSSVQRPIPAASVDYLLQRQIADGTWSWNGGTAAGSGDNNTAAIAVTALIAAGVPADHPQVQKTLAHFEDQQNEDGGFPYVKPSPFGTDSDANSTAVVMWALLAAGQDPAGVDWKYQGQDGHSALDQLRALQNESGAFRWQQAVADDNFASTVQALIALELKTVPFAKMDVGDAGLTASAAEEPVVLPETGANLWLQPLALLCGGIALLGAGLLIRRRS